MDMHTLPEPVDETSFRDALQIVVETAHENGIDVERDWACQDTDDHPNWAVDIVRLALTETTETR